MNFRHLKKTIYFSLTAFLIQTQAMGYELPHAVHKAPESESVAVLQHISKGVSILSKKASKAVVFVSISKTIKGHPLFNDVHPFEFFFGPRQFRQQQPVPERKQKGLGSGFIVDLDKGYIITNNHVIEGADEITIKLANNERYAGKVLGRDKNTDVAVIQIKDEDFKKDGLEALRIADSDDLSVGEFVVALGAPFGLEASISFGVVSATQRGNLQITNLGNFLQTDAAINPGNSGGPLINTKGHVIGMNTAIYSRSGSSAGIGFAVPANIVRRVAGQLINKGEVARGYLGVQLSQDLDDDIAAGLGLPEDTKGALIAHVQPGTPAAKGGVESGDVIVAVNDKKIKRNSDLTNSIGLLEPGTKVKLDLYRDGKKRKVYVELKGFPKGEQLSSSTSRSNESFLGGLKLKLVTQRNYHKWQDRFQFRSKKGLLIVDIEENSKAAAAGLKPGDVILKVNRKPIRSLKEFTNIYKKKSKLLIQFEREGRYLFASLRK